MRSDILLAATLLAFPLPSLARPVAAAGIGAGIGNAAGGIGQGIGEAAGDVGNGVGELISRAAGVEKRQSNDLINDIALALKEANKDVGSLKTRDTARLNEIQKRQLEAGFDAGAGSGAGARLGLGLGLVGMSRHTRDMTRMDGVEKRQLVGDGGGLGLGLGLGLGAENLNLDANVKREDALPAVGIDTDPQVKRDQVQKRQEATAKDLDANASLTTRQADDSTIEILGELLGALQNGVTKRAPTGEVQRDQLQKRQEEEEEGGEFEGTIDLGPWEARLDIGARSGASAGLRRGQLQKRQEEEEEGGEFEGTIDLGPWEGMLDIGARSGASAGLRRGQLQKRQEEEEEGGEFEGTIDLGPWEGMLDIDLKDLEARSGASAGLRRGQLQKRQEEEEELLVLDGTLDVDIVEARSGASAGRSAADAAAAGTAA
ncbi:MAG: hypothetical protein M1828_003023 [Chrysothrix sp. TS-e1954]|nr:MAG: hypothetical protein M1828_003023 [Chrysothrix sp. TS-e1954]